MKTYLQLTGLALAIILSGCSKNKDKNRNTFADNFRDQTWSGLVQYKTISRADPYTILFRRDNTFIWTDRSGQTPGNYSLNETDKKITLNFTGGKFVTIATKGDTTMASIDYSPGTQWTLYSFEKNYSASESIINTKWKSSRSGLTIEFSSSIDVNYLAGTKWTYTKEGSFIHGNCPALYSDIYMVINKNKLQALNVLIFQSDPYYYDEFNRQ